MNTLFPISSDYKDVFKHPAFKDASLLELFKEVVFGQKRIFDCIQVEVTSYCSAKCTYCPHTTMADEWNSRHMQAHTFANLWPLLKLTTRVHLQGWGEPLLNPHFFEFVALARKAGCQVSTTSCGLLFNEEKALKIIKSGIDILAFSLAGTDQESNSVRKKADFQDVYNAILNLQKIRKEKMAVHLEIHLAYILLADRLDAVYKLPQLMKELEIHETIISTLDYLPDDSFASLAITPQDIDIIEKSKEMLSKISKEAKSQEQEIYYALPSQIPSAICRENIQKSLYVDADGLISPCIYLNVPGKNSTHISFGNVNENNILDIWQNENFKAFRQAHEDGKTLEQCKNCVKKFEALY